MRLNPLLAFGAIASWLAGGCVARSTGDGIGSVLVMFAEADQDQIAQARTGQVAVRLENITSDPLTINSVTLRFSAADADVDSEYTVTPHANPTEIPAGGGVDWSADVVVSSQATAGVVLIDASATGIDSSGITWITDGARVPGSWIVLQSQFLVVTTTDDRDDTGGAGTLASAGGAADLSLREAILIANASSVGAFITFDAVSFGTAPAQIDLVGPLPTVVASPATIDGTGALVTVSGLALLGAVGLTSAADDFTLRGVTIRDFVGNGGECFGHLAGDRLQILDSTFANAGEGNNASVLIHSGRDHLVRNNVFRDGLSDGLRFSDQAVSGLVAQNTFLNNGDDGVQVLSGFSRGVRIENNVFTNHSNGVEIGGPNVEVVNNTFENCGVQINERVAVVEGNLFRTPSNAIWIASASDASIADNIIEAADSRGIRVAASSRISIIGNQIFGANDGGGFGIEVAGGTTNIEVLFNTILFFEDGINLMGGSATLRNNIIGSSGAAGLRVEAGSSLNESHNIFFANISDSTGVTLDPADLFADPNLVDAAAGDVTPQAVAIDAALLFSSIDRNGPEPGFYNGQGQDIGAIETAAP